MTATKIAETKSPELLEVMKRARDPKHVFLSLAHLITEEALVHAFHRIRKGAAVGVDGVTKEEYGRDLERNVGDLHKRMRTRRWRHKPIRRVYISKENGKSRPIGISSFEDKVVQEALREILDAIYEPVFHENSYGFRRGRSAHDALRALHEMQYRGKAKWILEIDCESYFDSIDRKKLLEMIRERVVDGSLKRLIGKCLHVGILEGQDYSEPETGTVQGSVLSPILGNIYLHHVLDVWFEHDVKPRLRGRGQLIRYGDDAVMGFEREEDARRVLDVLRKRFERFGLRLHPEKTRVIAFGRPSAGTLKGKGPGTYDFLGFTHYWRRTRKGWWAPRMKTRKSRVRRIVKTVAEWCRSHRHLPVKEQHALLTRRIEGHLNYFGVNGNIPSMRQVIRACGKAWRKWLNRRSQRAGKSWREFNALLRRHPLPKPRIRVQLWSAPS